MAGQPSHGGGVRRRRLEHAGALLQRCKTGANRLGFGTARQRMALERWTNHKPQRRTRSPFRGYRNGVPSCRGKSAGVAKRPRERSPTRNPSVTIRNLLHRCTSAVRPAAAATGNEPAMRCLVSRHLSCGAAGGGEGLGQARVDERVPCSQRTPTNTVRGRVALL
jgi:hypothetical protein